MTWAALLGALGGQSGGDSSGGGIGPSAKIAAGIAHKDKKANRRALNEARRIMREEAFYNYGNAKDAFDRSRDFAGQYKGNLNSDYLTPDMLMTTNRDQMGGKALETLTDAASGYNPVMGFDPYMGVLRGDRQAVSGLRNYAKANTEQTLSGWEAAAEDLARQYEDASAEQRGMRDDMRTSYNQALEDAQSEESGDLATHIVNTWISSDDASGAAGNNDFLDRRGRSNKNKRGRGKVKGAKEGAKREYVQELLDEGYTYEQLLSDPEFLKYVTSDENTRGLYDIYTGLESE